MIKIIKESRSKRHLCLEMQAIIIQFIQDNPFSVISTGQVSKGALILKYLRKNTKSLKGKKR